MRTLLIDVETSPALVYVFGFFKVFVQPEHVVEPPRMLCFSWRFLDEKKTQFISEYWNTHEEMVKKLHEILDSADVVVHFNGKSFDEPWARTEMKLAGLTPPSPYKSVDLYQQSKRFYLPSHKLKYVSTRLIDAGGKEETGGFATWVGCMNKDEKAWRLMKKYNIQDVDVMRPVYEEMRPWMTGLPNANLYDPDPTGLDRCRLCQSVNLERRGYAYTIQGKFQQYQCKEAGCGAWSRSTHRLSGVKMVEIR
jgi:hypothetical protein